MPRRKIAQNGTEREKSEPLRLIRGTRCYKHLMSEWGFLRFVCGCVACGDPGRSEPNQKAPPISSLRAGVRSLLTVGQKKPRQSLDLFHVQTGPVGEPEAPKVHRASATRAAAVHSASSRLM